MKEKIIYGVIGLIFLCGLLVPDVQAVYGGDMEALKHILLKVACALLVYFGVFWNFEDE